jgi:hypothetical protein
MLSLVADFLFSFLFIHVTFFTHKSYYSLLSVPLSSFRIYLKFLAINVYMSIAVTISVDGGMARFVIKKYNL